ncbi:MAG TPA: pyruvate, phosphate dikinase [Candidatus Limnocylindrales bacterium]
MTLVYDLDHQHGLPLPELKALVGGKAANLNVMATELGLPVPPGFVVTTAACRAFLAEGWPAGLDEQLRAHMARVEAVVGRRFGDASDPLLVSVRSGAPVSMPGMMDTILDLGLNETTAAGLGATAGDPGFAADCLRRFRAMYRDIVGSDAPDDPWLQLRGAVEAVFRSWNSERAKAYREHEGIPGDLGTAVTVQTMVFGNRGADSGTGVLFTRNPATGEATLYGDVMFQAQGEDVVAGTHATEHLSALDERLPGVAAELRGHATTLERRYADLCDIEFTVEQGRLWMLQVRVGKRSPQAALRMAVEMAEDPDFPLTRAEAVRRVADLLADPPRAAGRRADGATPLTVGLAASPGVANGEIVTSPDDAQAAAEAGRAVILVRSETSPDDVHGMARAAGILTARGGIASHAAVVARGWGIPAVVGASEVEVGADGIVVAGRRMAAGERITIDGSSGEVFSGVVEGGLTVVPEAETLLGWARELGIEVGEPRPDPADAEPQAASATPAPTAAAPSHPLAAQDLLRGLLVKGLVPLDGLAVSLAAPLDEVRPLVDGLVADGLAETTAGAFRLTPTGKLRALEVFTADGGRLGGEAPCVEALDAFLVLDARMKETVTAWQLREVDGQQTINDHADAAYDAGVLDRLSAIHADTIAWLGPLCGRLGRLETYCGRLGEALRQARAGDVRFVASPRVDSYHNVWFELHEDLIRLAGRRRSDEAAAGRA